MSDAPTPNAQNHSSQPSPLPLRCADVAPYLSAFADGELAEPLRTQVAAHLATCADCTAQLARYHAIDDALARLPRTAPSPDVFERVAAAVAGRASEPAVRESLGGRRLSRRRPIVELPAWAGTAETARSVPAGRANRSRMPRWAAAGLPTVAAILLVALTAFALRGLGWRAPQGVPTTVASPTLTTGDPLQQTHTAMQSAVAGRIMPFTPVQPTYVPGAPTFRGVSAHIIPDQSGNGAVYLDVTWTLDGPVTQVHLREGPKGSPWYGYSPATTSGLTWQAGKYQWTPLSVLDGSGRPAVGEMRDTMWIAIDVTLASNSSAASATQTLRLMSLSMDVAYQPLPAQIIPAPSTLMFHMKGQFGGSGGTIETYSYPAQNATRAEVYRADGAHYVDIASGQQGIRLDPGRKTYQPEASASLTPATLDQSGTQLFFFANTLAAAGELWYLGPAKYNGESAYDFALVDAPHLTHVYVDQQSMQVVAVTVDPGSSEHPGGDHAASRFSTSDGCASYSLIEYVQPIQSVSFSTTPPKDYTQGGVPTTLTCASGSGNRTGE